eukprot:640499-Amphidinium_carterae.1
MSSSSRLCSAASAQRRVADPCRWGPPLAGTWWCNMGTGSLIWCWNCGETNPEPLLRVAQRTCTHP